MNTASDWLEANARHMAAGVAWVRAVLREHGEQTAAPVTPQPAAPTAPRRQFWQRRQQQLALPPAENQVFTLDGGSSNLRAAPAREAMQAIAAAISPPPALDVLTERLGLSVFERDVLLLCAAMELDTSIAGLCAKAHGDATLAYPTFGLALSVFEAPAWDALSPERPLRHWRLLEITQPGSTPLTVSALRADERIVNFLKGVTYLDDRLAPLMAAIGDPGEDVPPSQREMAEAALQQLRSLPEHQQPPPIQLVGRDSASKQLVAGLVCQALGRQAYRLDWSLLPSAPADLEALARLWERESLLLPVALYVDTEAGDTGQSASVDRLLARVSGLVLLATRHLWAGSGRAPIAVEVAKPTEAEQLVCWQRALGDATGTLPDVLTEQFSLNAAMIDELARREAGDTATDPATLGERLWDACRALTRPRLDTLARRIEPRAGWDDIVLPPAETELLQQIADQVGNRGKVYREWGFAERMSRGLGISVLFAGASGSGKTMAAEVLAQHLRLDLFRIDLSAVVSKYIGETEANLRRLFDAAEDGGAILFFDEADALFGKRTEVKDSHDRYANIEINYLLQRMESYGGLAILATNMKTALDQAFMRRLRFIVDFPFPGPVERRAMWQKVFPPDLPITGLDYDRLAKLNVTGGHIAVIAMNAAFQAARADSAVTMPLLLNAARIEFRKLGRPINEADFRWQPTNVAAAGGSA